MVSPILNSARVFACDVSPYAVPFLLAIHKASASFPNDPMFISNHGVESTTIETDSVLDVAPFESTHFILNESDPE